MSQPTRLASELYARSQGTECLGPHKCHWCGGPCKDLWRHDDEVQIPFQKLCSTAKYHANPYVCVGCWMFRRQRVTVRFLRGGAKDGQAPMRHSWWITERGAWAVGPGDKEFLVDELVGPPRRFSLMLLKELPPSMAHGKQPVNHLHLAVINELEEVNPDSTLFFTVDGVKYDYSVYELEQGIKHGTQGRSGGVRALVELLGVTPKAEEVIGVVANEPEVKKRGRPKPMEDAKSLRKSIL